MVEKKRALGRGLDALLGNVDSNFPDNISQGDAKAILGSVINISVDKIEANPFQPRSTFDQEALDELAESIKALGIIQPITVRKLGYDKYQIISGERRFRASQIAGLKEVPVYVRVANDQAMLEMALVENIQREELDSIEIAISYERLIEECKITQEALSTTVGKKRSTITNYIRLLKLPPEIQYGVKKNQISMGHARAIINVEDKETQIAIYYDIIENELSVRQVESIVKDLKNTPYTSKKKNDKTNKESVVDEKITTLSNKLSTFLESSINIQNDRKGKGKIVISFKTNDDLERIIKLINSNLV